MKAKRKTPHKTIHRRRKANVLDGGKPRPGAWEAAPRVQRGHHTVRIAGGWEVVKDGEEPTRPMANGEVLNTTRTPHAEQLQAIAESFRTVRAVDVIAGWTQSDIDTFKARCQATLDADRVKLEAEMTERHERHVLKSLIDRVLDPDIHRMAAKLRELGY